LYVEFAQLDATFLPFVARILCRRIRAVNSLLGKIAIMATIEIYTSPFCGYCSRAKQLLARKGAAYTEIDVMRDGERRAEMTERAYGRQTVPQIFIDGRHIGGCDELYALDATGGLDPLLAKA
jgi:glutaredoxin 3